MNNEIKEILDYFRKYMTIDDCIRLNKIEDYITNLQENYKEADNDRHILFEQKEKAISIIKDIFKDEDWYENYEYNDLESILKEVYQTLQGSDKE